MRVLVTGGTGFVGSHIVAALIRAQGTPAGIRVMARKPALRLEQWGVEVMRGDVTSARDCARALHGVQQVYHAAGVVSRRPEDGPQLLYTYVQGTRTLLAEVQERAPAARVIVVSSSGTTAVSREPHEVTDETGAYRLALLERWPYFVAKVYQEQAALEFAQRLDVVVVNPSLVLGPGDMRGSSTGDVQKVVLGRLPVVPRGGGVAVVDARDVAKGCLLAMKRGVRGRRYLLSAANMTLERLVTQVAALAGSPMPRALLAPRTMHVTGRLLEALYRRLAAPPPVHLQSIEMAEYTWYCNARRARVELGWQPRDVQETLADTVRDIQERCSLRTHLRAAS